MLRIIFLSFILLFYPIYCFAKWDGPINVFDLEYGNGPSQIGIEYGDTEDVVRTHIAIDEKGVVIIGDAINRNLLILFSGGEEYTTVTPKIDIGKNIWPIDLYALGSERLLVTSGYKHQIYNYDGSLVGVIDLPNSRVLDVDQSGNIYIKSNRIGVYDFNGQFLRFVDNNSIIYEPVIKKIPSGEYVDNIIKIKNIVYKVKTQAGNISYINSFNDGLMIYGKYEKGPMSYRVDQCGKIIGSFIVPGDQLTSGTDLLPIGVDAPAQDYIFTGPVKFGADGNAYAWVRTPSTYSITKWTWVDSPDDPQPGPDAPSNLTVQLSIDGLYLTWGASPQDPGCVDGYEVERSTSAGGIYTLVKTTDPGVLKFNDTGALPGSTYFYKVRAKSGSTYSPYTEEMSGTR
jgi:hypothetical protein